MVMMCDEYNFTRNNSGIGFRLEHFFSFYNADAEFGVDKVFWRRIPGNHGPSDGHSDGVNVKAMAINMVLSFR